MAGLVPATHGLQHRGKIVDARHKAGHGRGASRSGPSRDISSPGIARAAFMIHVCSLARLHPTVESTGARHVVTLLRHVHLVSRPSTIALDNHLVLAMDDISLPLEGYSPPADEHVMDLVKFLRGWDRRAPPATRCPPL